MKDKNTNLIANKLVKAFLKNKIINPLSSKYTKSFLMLTNLENYVRVKLKNQSQDLKQGGRGYLL